MDPSIKIKTIKTAFKNAAITYRIKFRDGDSLERVVLTMEEKLRAFRTSEHSLKFNMAIHVEFEKGTDSDIITDPPVVLQSEQFEVYDESNIKEQLKKVIKQLDTDIEVYEQCGSGWILNRYVSLDTSIWKLDPLRGSTFHKLPSWIIENN